MRQCKYELSLAVMVLMIATLTGGCAAVRPGILVMAHGGDDAWNQSVQTVVGPLRTKYPVEIAFGMARASAIEEAVKRLENQGVNYIAVVRMFISGDSFLETTEYVLGLRGRPLNHHGSNASHHLEHPEPIQTKALLLASREGVSDSSLIDEILVDRVKELSIDPDKESVLILAHGPRDDAENERWLANMRLRVQRIHELGRFKHIQCETLREDWDERRTEAEGRIRKYVRQHSENGGLVIVVPFRIAGFGPYRKVLDGLPYIADGRGFCPHPNMTRWIEQTARTCWKEGILQTRHWRPQGKERK